MNKKRFKKLLHLKFQNLSRYYKCSKIEKLISPRKYSGQSAKKSPKRGWWAGGEFFRYFRKLLLLSWPFLPNNGLERNVNLTKFPYTNFATIISVSFSTFTKGGICRIWRWEGNFLFFFKEMRAGCFFKINQKMWQLIA